GNCTQFGSTHRGEILGMGKEHRPPVTNPFMKVDRALGRFGGKVWGNVVNAKRHSSSWRSLPCFLNVRKNQKPTRRSLRVGQGNGKLKVDRALSDTDPQAVTPTTASHAECGELDHY